jgi:adenylate cyclase
VAKTKWLPMGRTVGYLVLVLAACLLHQAGALQRIEFPYLDWQMRLGREFHVRPTPNDVTVVAFDEDFLDAAPEPFALFHPHLAGLLDALRLAGPQLVAFDIALPDRSFHDFVPRERPDYDYDRELLRALGLASREFPVLLARTLDASGKRLREIHAPFQAVANRSPRLPAGLSASGSAVLCVDADETIRRYPDAGCAALSALMPLAALMAAVQGNRQDWRGLIDYTAGPSFMVVPAREVIAAGRRGDQAWLAARFAGRAVLVGIAFRDEDRHLSPVSLLGSEPENPRNPGVLLHAQLYRALMNHGLVTPLHGAQAWLLLAAGALFWFGASRTRKFLLLLAASAAAVVASFWFMALLIHMPALSLLAVAWAAFLLRAAADAYDNWLERGRLENAFSGYVSPQLMRRLQSGEISPDQRGAKEGVCVLFADICGFTQLSERLPPEQVVVLLNDYFAAMTAAIHRHGGVVDKLIGDGIMALFGQPERLAAPEQAALEAAHEMLARLESLNRDWERAHGLRIACGIGIHAGEAIIGFIGSRRRHEFTAIGDTVNAASRLEGLTRSLGYPVVCSETVAAAVGFPDFLVDLGPQPIKGHSALRVFGWRPQLVGEVAG